MPLHIVSEKDYYLEVSNDDDSHYIRIASFNNFDAAATAYRNLVKDDPDMRVTMRRRAHIYEHYIPVRLRKPTDRRP